MATVQDVYDLICYDLLEDGGLILGMVTPVQFLNLFNLTLADYIRETCPYLLIFTETVVAGYPRHDIPPTMMRVDHAFLAGVYLEQSTVERLNTVMRGWRYDQAQPLRWHSDQLPLQTMELAPVPNYNGVYIPGPNEPDPPHAQFGAFSVEIDGVVVQADVHEGVTMVGPERPSLVAELNDAIPLLDDDFALADLGFGVLERIFSGDNEMKNEQVAMFCGALYHQGIAVLKAIMCEPGEDS